MTVTGTPPKQSNASVKRIPLPLWRDIEALAAELAPDANPVQTATEVLHEALKVGLATLNVNRGIPGRVPALVRTDAAERLRALVELSGQDLFSVLDAALDAGIGCVGIAAANPQAGESLRALLQTLTATAVHVAEHDADQSWRNRPQAVPGWEKSDGPTPGAWENAYRMTTDDYDLAGALEHQRNLDQIYCALAHGGATTVGGCWITPNNAPPAPAAVVLLNGRLHGSALVAAAPHIVEMLRAWTDDLEASAAPPDHVPPAWLEGGSVPPARGVMDDDRKGHAMDDEYGEGPPQGMPSFYVWAVVPRRANVAVTVSDEHGGVLFDWEFAPAEAVRVAGLLCEVAGALLEQGD